MGKVHGIQLVRSALAAKPHGGKLAGKGPFAFNSGKDPGQILKTLPFFRILAGAIGPYIRARSHICRQ